MYKFLLSVVATLLLLPFSASAQNTLLWQSDAAPNHFFNIRQEGDNLAFIILEPAGESTSSQWEAYFGTFTDNRAILTNEIPGSLVLGPNTFLGVLNFVDENTAVLTVQSCTPVDPVKACLFPTASVSTFTRFF